VQLWIRIGQIPFVMPNPASLDEASCSCYLEDAPEYRISHPAAPGVFYTDINKCISLSDFRIFTL
jgi:hypothetical protein